MEGLEYILFGYNSGISIGVFSSSACGFNLLKHRRIFSYVRLYKDRGPYIKFNVNRRRRTQEGNNRVQRCRQSGEIKYVTFLPMIYGYHFGC